MKIRAGFVSNSSTSSYLVFGTCEDDLCKLLFFLEGLCMDDTESGQAEGEHLMFVTDSSDIYYAGIYPGELLKAMNLDQLTIYFKELLLREFGIDIKETNDCFGLFYGESCSD